MKLKKIASLALAGVMAVSMLAGCNNGTGNSGNVVENNGDLAAKVIAALDKDTTETIAFSTDADLKADVEQAMRNVGFEAVNAAGWFGQMGELYDALKKIDDAYNPANWLDFSKTDDKTDNKTLSKTLNATIVLPVNTLFGYGYSEEYIVKNLAAALDEIVENGIPTGSSTFKLVPSSATKTDSEGNEYWYNFDYTGKLAVVSVSDAVNGKVSYVLAISVTRTSTKVEK